MLFNAFKIEILYDVTSRITSGVFLNIIERRLTYIYIHISDSKLT